MACLIFGAGSFYGLPRSVEAGDLVIAADGGTGIHVGNKTKGFVLAGEIAVYIESVRAALLAGLFVALNLEACFDKRLFEFYAECALVTRFAAY